MSPPFAELLTLIDERSSALRAVVSASGTELRVPGCPAWNLRDLVVHVGQVQRSWAAHARAAGADTAPVTDVPTADLLEWSAASTQDLLDALRESGSDAPCWTWWNESDAPCNTGAVARHQVQEAALHAYDAQSAAGKPQDLPPGIAIDCVDEFLVVSLGTMGAWPHAEARVDFAATEGMTWSVRLTEAGAKIEATATGEPDTTVAGPAGSLILALYSRIPPSQLQMDGDPAVVEQLVDWARMSTG